MKRTTIITLSLVMLASAATAGMGVSRGHDLDDLWLRAQDGYDLDTLDAVLLLEGRHVEITPHGDLSTTVHRVVWIGTKAGLNAHADLRIPWNSDTSKLEVGLLRTWRDERWWPSPDQVSETAVVNTLPYAIDRCPDYAGMRETMLLHDGVELPCIMETTYTITERGVAAPGADDYFVMTQRDPAVRVEYRVTAPKIPVQTRSLNGAPEPMIEGNSRVWLLEDVPRLRLPITLQPVRYEPTLMWSSWPNHESMMTSYTSPLETAAVIDAALADTVAARLDTVGSDFARVRTIVDMLTTGVRGIHYDDAYWARTPRTAGLVWDTAYGHDLDRTVLALALFRTAGLSADLALWATDGPFVDDFPCSALLDRRQVRILDRAGNPLTFFDPAHNALLPVAGPEYDGESSLRLDLHLTPDDEGDWSGRGLLVGHGALSPHIHMAGVDDEATEHIDAMIDAALLGATITGHNPEIFMPRRVEIGFGFDFAPGEADEDSRIRIDLGNLPGGVFDELPHDVRLEDTIRESPVFLHSSPQQSVTLRIALDGLSVVRAPEPRTVANKAGVFEMTVVVDNDLLEITRTLSIAGTHHPADRWSDLRTLLLEDVDPANQVVMLQRD